MNAENTTTIDCIGLSHVDLYNQLASSSEEQAILLVGGTPTLAPAFSGVVPASSVTVSFDLGDFAGLLGRFTALEVDGNVGIGCGSSLQSGTLLVRRKSSHYLASHAKGGLIAALGSSGDFCGFGLNGGDVFVRSAVGKYAGCQMRGGTLVLGNGAGKELGRGATGGVIYVRGDTVSVSDDVKPFRMKDPDLMRLTLLLARAGIKSDGKDFRAFRPKAGKS